MELHSSMGVEIILNRDGLVTLHRNWLSETSKLWSALSEDVAWKHDVVKVFGKELVTKRQICWMAENQLSYRYSGITKQATRWHPEVKRLAEQLKNEFGFQCNSCLLNRYQSGKEGMGYHSDDEPELDESVPIASLSLGSNRPFFFKHKKTGTIKMVELGSGDLLFMNHENQLHWKHSLPVRKRIVEPRINLTFRSRK